MKKVGSHQESNPGHLWLEPNGILTAHAEWFARCATEAFSTTSAVNIEDCEVGGCPAVACGSVAEHWWLKPEVSGVRFPVIDGFFHFLISFITGFIVYSNHPCC